MVASQGLEPQQAESESAVLPLHHEANSFVTFSYWRGRRGSNPQPPDRQSSALTNCATTPCSVKVSVVYHNIGDVRKGEN